jgi:hypothetical protein
MMRQHAEMGDVLTGKPNTPITGVKKNVAQDSFY